MKRFLLFLLCLLPSYALFADDIGNISVIEGYNDSANVLSHIGNGRNETEAVVDALSGLEHLISLEISNRCNDLSKCVTRECISTFIRFSAINIKTMTKEILRFAYNRGAYKTPTGYAVVYSVDCDKFEEMFEGYIRQSIAESEKLENSVPELVSVNRFLKNRYSNSQEKEIRLAQ